MPDAGTAVFGGLSLLSGEQAADDASDARGLQRAQLQLEADRDQFNRDQIEQMNAWTREDRADVIDRRDRARDLYDPLEQGMVERAAEGPDYEGAMARSDADVAQSYGMARQQDSRFRSRYGINVASGAAQAMNRRSSNAEALAKVSGRQYARDSEDDRDWARKMAAIGAGNMRNVSPNTNLSQLGVSGQSGVLGNMAQQSASSASAGYGLAGSLAADAVDSYRNRRPPVRAGAGASSTYGVGTYRNNPDGGFSGGF